MRRGKGVRGGKNLAALSCACVSNARSIVQNDTCTCTSGHNVSNSLICIKTELYEFPKPPSWCVPL